MKFQNWSKRIVPVLGVCGALTMAFMSNSKNISAANIVSSEKVFENVSAGAAQVLEFNTVPSEEEINDIFETNYSWKNEGALVMAEVSNSVNVRALPDAESEKEGVLYKDCGAYIIEYQDEWTKVKSGNLEGWVNNDYLLFGEEADKLADEVGCLQATVNSKSLRVRKEASQDSEIYGLVTIGDKFDVVREDGDWLVIEYEGADGYINKDYADVSFHIDYGETVNEIKEREEAERKAKREAERNKNYASYSASVSDVELLGALIQCEAGNQSYEGKVAVGAVVLNRVRSGAYPNTINGVVYASGQFTPAGSGALDRRIAAGVNSSCIQAAAEAIGGRSNVGAATHFKSSASGHDGIVIGGHVFW